MIVLRDVHDLCMVRALKRPIMLLKCAQDAWFMHDKSLTTQVSLLIMHDESYGE
jgi:hypothetical protein